MFGGPIKHPIKFFFKGILYRLLVGRILIIPFSFLFLRKKRLTVFIGRDDGQFVDNTKHLFLYLQQLKPSNTEYYFLTENRDTYGELMGYGLPVLFHPSLKSILKLLRVDIVVVDNVNWIQKFKFNLAYKSRKVQLFHGVPLKKIGLKNPQIEMQRRFLIMRVYHAVAGQYPNYDMFLATSAFFGEKVFANSYKSRRIFVSGYPRNDVLFTSPGGGFLREQERILLEKINRLKASGLKIVLYVPTFRDHEGDALSANRLDLQSLSDFAVQNNIYFLFKFHLHEKSRFHLDKEEPFDNICFLPDIKDIYPFMPLADLMITDYSSIFFDFLLLKRPIVFFPFDLDTFLTKDRGLNFDYDKFTPGPRCMTQVQLEKEISTFLVKGKDEYHEKRDEICDIAFKYNAGNSCERVWNEIETLFLEEKK
jgi:CDP-glycerol glycerophosphotransferase (TagB/SpsB family)